MGAPKLEIDMKLLVAVVAFTVFTVAADVLSDIQVAVDECKVESNLKNIDDLRTKDPNTPEEKCFVGCFLQKFDALNSNGEFDMAMAMKAIDECPVLKKDAAMKKEFQDVISACASKVTGSDKCTSGPQLLTCMRQNFHGNTDGFPLLSFKNIN